MYYCVKYYTIYSGFIIIQYIYIYMCRQVLLRHYHHSEIHICTHATHTYKYIYIYIYIYIYVGVSICVVLYLCFFYYTLINNQF